MAVLFTLRSSRFFVREKDSSYSAASKQGPTHKDLTQPRLCHRGPGEGNALQGLLVLVHTLNAQHSTSQKNPLTQLESVVSIAYLYTGSSPKFVLNKCVNAASQHYLLYYNSSPCVRDAKNLRGHF